MNFFHNVNFFSFSFCICCFFVDHNDFINMNYLSNLFLSFIGMSFLILNDCISVFFHKST
jgi:hypothetical protein